ncbi:NAD(P)-binding protein [Aspergillus uvarum CBS 121591]|uniref:NAD(P)-binding protein n=1 Tax=Aspergillus uvarum CBS 121591 TaxID=1448315 RepID=A0A319C273_9EURO|nr:NAD(P)-binding protein [Aspergillus uvarum CBS 121591]PYH79185.1 NAD(P)-binding protein [Aspergillus uvarum CBS 121591]
MAPFSGLRATLTQIYPPKPVFTEADIPAGSLQGRVYIVTGGNAGIGLELVKILYAGGGTIYIASRSKDKVEAAIKDITSQSSNAASTTRGKLKFLHLDLNDLKTVQAAAASFAEQESQLHVLWNNAGTGANAVPVGQRTAQDFELFIGRHCIATLLFTQLLLPQLRAAAAAASPGDGGPTRVIWTSSGLAEAGSPPNGIDWKVIDQGTNKSAQNYGASKAGTWFLSREFARRYKKDGIVSVCLNPGYLKTASFNGTPALVMFILNRVMLSEPIYGAYTELFAGLSPEVTLETSGAYIIPWGRIRPNTATGRQDLIKAGDSKEEGGLGYGEKLWDWCEKQWAPYV